MVQIGNEAVYDAPEWTGRPVADAGRLRARLEEVLRLEDPAVLRLGSAGTSIAFVVTDGEPERVTLLLDREPPEISDVESAEITVEMTARRAREFSTGRLVLSTCLIAGEAQYTGPARKYLAVDPILRGLLARVEDKASSGAER